MIRILLYIGLGGFLGSILRFTVQQAVDRWVQGILPFGILTVNIIGSLLMGLIFGIVLHKNILSDEWRLFLATGFCGGFTTFSAFSFDNVMLLNNGEYMHSLLYSGGSVVLAILSTMAGIYLVRLF